MCHTDVVPADRREWFSDPFIPLEKDGYLYGRGTADIKSMCAAELSILLWLKRGRILLARDVIFFAEADEETGNKERHIDWLLKEHGEKLEAEFAINEGGNTLWGNGRPTEIRIQAAEKEYMDIILTARGPAGHASVPRLDNPVAALARAVVRVGDFRPPARLSPVVRAFLKRQAQSAAPPLKEAIQQTLEAAPGPDLDRVAERLASVNPEYGAMLRDTVTPTILKAGYKSNVVPSEASAVFNARLLPGRTPLELVEELKSAIIDPAIEISYDPPTRQPVGPMPIDTALYRAAQEAARELSPEVLVMPFMAAWSTDSQDLRARGVTTYGIDPPLSEEDGEGVHGKNERISLAALDWYAGYLREIVLRVARK
jgi:acetylornithine deacetylase/succinyl-diaminopimelate desuccinylase-like protein